VAQAGRRPMNLNLARFLCKRRAKLPGPKPRRGRLISLGAIAIFSLIAAARCDVSTTLTAFVLNADGSLTNGQ